MAGSNGVRKALLVIDMQNDLCRDARRELLVATALSPLLRLIDAFASNDGMVIYPCFALADDDDQFDRFGDRYCIAGTPGAGIISELHPLRGPILIKTKHSAFFNTDLDSQLRTAGVQDLYLAGLQTQICIMTTAADASFRGYRAVAVSDCVVSTRTEAKRQALDWIERYVGEVMDSSSILHQLLDD
jgi:nicotinamidase-related amidase